MAEHGAHLTSTLQVKPSIFEVVASDSLHSTFNPAIRKLFNFLASINPEKYGWTIKYYDELYLILNGVIQQYYLRVYGSSLSEAFYNLTRISSTTTIQSNKLTTNVKLISFITICILPYVRIKFEKLLTKWKLDFENINTNSSSSSDNKLKYYLYKKYIIKYYNIIIAITDFLQIFQYLYYLADKSKSHTILLRLLNIQLTYTEIEENEPWSWTDFLKGNLRCSTILTSFIFRGLELSAFFLQFIQWWQTETNQTHLINLPIPKPPDYNVNSNKYLGICPICLQTWQIPTAISISGYVYCYKCIIKHFETKQNCPVTNLATNLDDLIRIYEA